jgi:hypothetical protein
MTEWTALVGPAVALGVGGLLALACNAVCGTLLLMASPELMFGAGLFDIYITTTLAGAADGVAGLWAASIVEDEIVSSEAAGSALAQTVTRANPGMVFSDSLILPVGKTQGTFDDAVGLLRNGLKQKDYNGDLLLHGSRVGGRPTGKSDFDFAIRVSPDEFNRIATNRLKGLKVGGDKWQTIQHGIRVGKLQRGEIGLSGVGKAMQRLLDVEMDISVIKAGGEFDQGPWYVVAG